MQENLVQTQVIEQHSVKLNRVPDSSEDYSEKPICPYCESRKYWTAGLTNQGIQRYKCKDCKHQYQMTYLGMRQEKPSKKIECRKCGSSSFRKCGKTETEIQRYQCHNCGFKFIENPATPYYSRKEYTHNGQDVCCVYCNGINITRNGPRERNGYRCKDCRRNFYPSPKGGEGYLKTASEDVWDSSELGLNHSKNTSGRGTISFEAIRQPWLKDLAKNFIKYTATSRTFGTLLQYISGLKSFSEFIADKYAIERVEDIDRAVIVSYLEYLAQQELGAVTRTHRIAALELFFRVGNMNRWFEAQPYLFLPEDRPKIPKNLPRYIPEEVISQLNQHLDALPEPIMRMTLIIQECGLRISELRNLRRDCLKQDASGGWFIQFMRGKTNKETTLPVSLEIAAVIQEQQKYISDHLRDNFEYLFCGRVRGATTDRFAPTHSQIGNSGFIDYLKRLAERYDICDASAKRWQFQSHQFRHTVGTRMVNAGVPLTIIQRYLGHESPTMTMTYAHIFDETLKQEISKYHHNRTVNIVGKVVQSENPELDNDQDLQWMKKKILAQALPNGSCARPVVKGSCPHANACLTCGDFRTTKEFLSIHKEELAQTEKVIEKAKANDWQRQVEMNEQVKKNLKNIIQALEGNNE